MTTATKAPARGGRARARARMVFATTALLGALLVLYPMYSQWFARVGQGDAVVDYSQMTSSQEAAERERQLAEADAYNATLSGPPLIDPFAGTDPAGTPRMTEDATRYLGLLDSDPAGIMGVVTTPKLDVTLPIYHGATETVLRTGAGHVYGSSLPVGGPGTHAVIAGHSGIPGSRFFNDLGKLAAGDTFKISSTGRELYYKVTTMEVVTPDQIGSLVVEPGVDQVTLLTCTPVRINSHRLLVHAVRTNPPPDAWSDEDAARWPIPWWIVPVGFASAAWVAMLRNSRGRAGGRAGAQ